jgi:hypothetical protein
MVFFRAGISCEYDRRVPEWCRREKLVLDDVCVWLLGTDVFYFATVGTDVIHG